MNAGLRHSCIPATLPIRQLVPVSDSLEAEYRNVADLRQDSFKSYVTWAVLNIPAMGRRNESVPQPQI